MEVYRDNGCKKEETSSLTAYLESIMLALGVYFKEDGN